MRIEDQYLYGYTLALDSLEDYLASRTLLERDQPLVAIQLGTTAIEKLFKSFIKFSYEGKFEFKSHSPRKIYEKGADAFRSCNLEFDINFLQWLDDIYITRYSSCIYPAKEITFGENQFLGLIDFIFFKIFSHFKLVNAELSQLYFCTPFQSNLEDAFFKCSKLSFEEYVSKEQKIYSIFYLSGRRTDVKTSVVVYKPENPFVYKDAEVEDDKIIVRLNFGKLSPLDLPPSYYLNLGVPMEPLLISLD